MRLPIVSVSYVFLVLARAVHAFTAEQGGFSTRIFYLHGAGRIRLAYHRTAVTCFMVGRTVKDYSSARAPRKMVATFHPLGPRHSQMRYRTHGGKAEALTFQ